MVLLESSADASQHHHALLFGRLFHLHYLEAARQGGVLLEVLLILRPGSRRDRAHFAARQSGLEQVGCVALAGLPAGTNHGVGLVDKKNDRRGRRLHLCDETFQPVLELALDPRAGLQQGQVEGADGDVLKRRRHVAIRDAQGEPFDDGRLADARLARENRVVLAPPHEDVDNLPNLEVPAEYRIHLAGLGVLGEIDGVLIQVRRLAAGGAGFALGVGLSGAGRDNVLARAVHDGFEFLPEAVGLDLLKLLADGEHLAGQFLVDRQCQDREARADLPRSVIDGADGPRLGQHCHQARAQRRRSGVAGLQFVEAAGEFGQEPRLVHLEA